MQLMDRRPQAGPSSSSTSTVTVTSPMTSPSKATGFHQAARTQLSESSNSSQLWTKSIEDNALNRTQQFIIETHKNPVRFILSEAPVSAEVPYPAINDSNLLAKKRTAAEKMGSASRAGTVDTSPSVYTTEHTTTAREESSESPRKTASPAFAFKDLFAHRISLHPPKDATERGVGLINKGNTCYMNSTLQALLHLPPLSHALLTFDESQLYGRMGGKPVHKFDGLGEMAKLAERVLTRRGGGTPTAPIAFIANLKLYARTLSKFRQEDAHEFLRFLLESMQQCCLIRAPKSMKPTDSLRETTIIHKIFGGKLRSRVQCQRCKHNSDTFDPILDLSLDLRKSSSVHEALERFTSVDVLTGSERYKCEKCKKAVDATKGFTIHEPPLVLTIHLKRFTLSGQKINRQINYPDSLILTRGMLSEGLAPHYYKLRSVVHHHGNSPNSGHYVASVRGKDSNRWYEMNDSSVYPTRGQPVNMHDAYILFYVRDPSHALSSIVRSEPSSSLASHKRRLSEREVDERPTKKRDEAEAKRPLGTAINPNSFYGSSPSHPPPSRKSPMFRNMDSDDSNDGGGGDDDVGEIIESQSTHRPPVTPPMSDKARAKKRKQQHRDTLGLGIRAGNKKSSSLVTSPFNVGRDSLHNTPFHARMKDRQGKRFK